MTNTAQIEKNIANILRSNPIKLNQMKTVQDICYHLTSDDGIWITAELYNNNIVRYLIQGTRSGMTITAHTLTNSITRKPIGVKPWATRIIDTRVSNILDRI